MSSSEVSEMNRSDVGIIVPNTGDSMELSRRRFIKVAGVAGIATLLGQIAPASVLAATPTKGGHFRVGCDDGNTADSLEPGSYTTNFLNLLTKAKNNYLVEIAEDNSIIPELATHWEPSNGGQVWVFDLRRDVEFHNGKTLTSDDVIASLNFHRGENSKSAAKSLMDQIDEITADGKSRIVIKLRSGSADLPYFFTELNLPIMPSNMSGTIDWESGVGTGGYKLQRFEPGSRAELIRNPNYFKSGRAHFEAVTLIAMPDTNSRQNAVSTGEIDAMLECDLRTVKLLQRNPDVRIDAVEGGSYASFPMQIGMKPFDSNDVRMAIKYSIDRELAVKTVLGGFASVGNDHPIPKASEFFDASIEQRHYDPERSRYHLKKAGLENLRVQLHTSEAAFPGAVDMAAMFKATAQPAGIDVDIVRQPKDGYWSDVWMKKPFCASFWGQRPTPDMIFSLGYAADAPWNETGFKNPRFNELLRAARTEFDKARRTEMYHEMQSLVRDDGGSIIPFFKQWVGARRSNVEHSGGISGDWPLDGGRGVERWWFSP
ncbi:twin-arginine translocation signal domain-containing protein [Mesorhizobium sp. M1A.T.Ca.IN.004.03.1.1]|nr:twin-arginine translocation signal domain-containing protein [Mesorhizobium sp. M1A.T.Ca.IN.004.03.1.1]